MMFPEDRRAIYHAHTESITTSAGQHLRLREIHAAFTAVNPYQFRNITRRAGVSRGIEDPFEKGQANSVADLLALIRGMPRYALPLVQSGLSFPETKRHFDGLVHDRLFGSAQRPKSAGNAAWNRPSDPYYSEKVSRFFFDTRDDEGDFSYFIREDRKAAVLRNGQRFSTDGPYRESFLVFRDIVGRFFLRWPSEHASVPAYYLDSEGQAVDFYAPDDADFAELYPGWTYEVFGVQFAIPNIGTNYRDFGDEAMEEEEVGGASRPAGSQDRRLELLEILEAVDADIPDGRALSKHFRQISIKYHPLKHLQASDAEKARVNRRYLEITNAYNELKPFYERSAG
jgi:hypothetical protein